MSARFLRRSTRSWLIASIIALAVGAVAAEGAARLLGLAPVLDLYGLYTQDPFSVYKPRPFSESTLKTEEFSHVRRHNSLGFRDVEHEPAKPPGVFRILGLGDSFTYGIGVEFEQTYLKRLEVLLNSRSGAHARVEIINQGIPRFFPEPERIVMERYGMQYAPDLVLVGFLPNDVADTYMGIDAVTVDESGYLTTREARRLGSLARWFFLNSHVARVVLNRYVQYRIARDYPVHEEDLLISNGFHESDWQKIEDEYARMNTIAASLNARFVVVHIPQKGPWSKEDEYPAERFSQWSVRHGSHFIDVLPAMRVAAGQKLYYPLDGHCTAEGYEVIAQTIFRELTATGIVP